MRVAGYEQSSHYGCVTVVDRSTTLGAPAATVWKAVKTPEAFRYVTRALLSMPAIGGRHEPWREGETVRAWVFLFGLIPFSYHRLTLASIDDVTMTLSSAEHGGLIRRWNHDIVVAPLTESSCVYRDTIDIDAGVFTPAVALYARWFYYMRQRRWRQLAPKLNGRTRGT